jgi:peptide/nickel transport system substrate-binding protein
VTSAAERPTGTVTFLFTDIEGSTRLLKQLRDAYATALADHQRIVRDALAANDGWEIDTQGDSFFAAFRRAKDAVAAAVDIQRALAAHEWPDGTQLRVRMGIHTGEPAVGGERYVGLGVHRAARIAAAAHGGQVLVSATTRELLRDDPPPDVSLRDLGEHQLKDMDEPERLYQLDAPGLATEFQPLKTQARSAIEGREGEVVEAARGTVRQMAMRWRTKRIVQSALVAAAIVLAAVLAFVLTRGSSASASAEVSANSVGVIDPRSGKLDTEIAVGQAPAAVASGRDAVWVANANDNAISKIDPDRNGVRDTIQVGDAPSGIAVGGNAVWVTNGLDGTLSKISSDQVVQNTQVGNGPSGVAYGGGALWVANAVDGTVVRVDPGTGRVASVIPVANGVTALTFGFGRLWVVAQPSGTVLALDPKTGDIVDRIGVGVDPDAIATGARAVWVVNRSDGTLSRVDPHAGSVTDVIAVGRDPVAVAADAKDVWVASAGSGTISRVDPKRVRVTKTIRVANSPRSLAVTPAGIYVAVRGTGASHRGGKLRVLSGFGYDFLDPALAYTSTGWSILSMTNDGLVGFRRVGGIQGIALVPDLAASLPAPGNGGRTWTFRLRPDIRYSTGKPVEPQDFRRAIERLFEITKPPSPGAPYFRKIVGASACTAKRCDLSAGIVTDTVARTITFRLTAPDPDFLAKLALAFAYPVPARTPATDRTKHPVPATGPYLIKAVRRQLVTLVRNPRFREWSSDAQPDGYPDEIVFDSKPPTAGIRTVNSGAADLYLNVDLAGSRQELDQLATQSPNRLRLSTTAITNYFFLNTRVPPFDDVRARLAVNYAFDRQAFANVIGRTAAPTCQLLPPNSASFHRTCPYLPNGLAGLDKARGLVRASGTAGSRVSVWVPAKEKVQGDFMVTVLRSLGYRVRLKLVKRPDAYFPTVLDTRTRAQTGFDGWQADFPSESAFLAAQFACSAFAPAAADRSADPSFFCDPSIDRLMARAEAVQAVNPPAAHALWRQAEHRLLAAAPMVPTYNRQTADFLSRRVGNYQFHPQWGALVDQLWVR